MVIINCGSYSYWLDCEMWSLRYGCVLNGCIHLHLVDMYVCIIIATEVTEQFLCSLAANLKMIGFLNHNILW